jgi:serine/threonine protein phosphatase PrpC
VVRPALREDPLSPPQTFLFAAEDRVEAEPPDLGFGRVVVRSRRSPAKSGPNEDAAAVVELDPGRGLLAVADGVGGLPGGREAASLALEALCAGVAEGLAQGAALREAVLSGMDRANRAVIERGRGGATTLVVVEIDGPSVRTYHVGDSAALVFGGRGRLKLQTIAHSPTGYALEAGLMDEEQAMEHEDRHVVSNVIGDPAMHVGLCSPLRLAPRDTLVVASDGLWDNLSTEAVVEVLRRGRLAAAAQSLVESAWQRMQAGGKPDDLTLIAYRPRSARRET